MENQTTKFKSVKSCPFCNTIQNETKIPLETYDSFEISAGQGEKFFHPSFKVISCQSCSLLYKSATPSSENLNQYYSVLDTDYENVDILFPTDRVAIDYITGFSKDASILDYGCGSGRLLSKIQGTDRKFGVEVNQRAIDLAQQRRIKIIKEEELDGLPDYFDIIILTDVYEHLSQPGRLLKLLLRTMKKGGRLIISTGIADEIEYKDRLGYYWYFRLFSHLHMLTSDHLIHLANDLNVSIEFTRKLSHYDASALVKLKRSSANVIFWLYNRTIFKNMQWMLPEIKSVKKWKYPIFDMYNKDHIICALKKL